MDVLKFKTTSPFSIFKKNDARFGLDLTYSHIHKNVIKGIVGAIIGLEGYNVHSIKKRMGLTNEDFPEFYTKLENLKVSIVPVTENGDFEKFIETFTETQGMFGDKGGTLIVKEQQISKGNWEIYLKLDELEEAIAEKIKDYFLNSKAEYLPYLGKNEHFATITDVELLTLKESTEDTVKIDSLFIKNADEEIDYNSEDADEEDEIATYYLEELMPVSLDKTTGRYVLETLVFTDTLVERETYQSEEGKHLVFI